jgi:hypothetical protein
LRKREFYEQVTALFKRANQRLWEPYEETLFLMKRPVTHGNFWRVKRFVGGNPPQSALNDTRVHRDLDHVLSSAKYPEATALARLEDFSEHQAELASALLHFNNPAYPIFDEPSVRGLNDLGTPITFHHIIGETSVDDYQAYIDAIQELKEGVPFYCVPEKNYYLTRIIQETLWELGMEQPIPGAVRKAPSRRPQP